MSRDINNTGTPSNLLSSLCANIYEGNYVLVLGSDIILKQDYAEGNSHKYILSELDNELSEAEGNNERKNILRDILQGGNGTPWQWDINKVSDNLRTLLKTRCFRVVLTTTFDSYIEAAMQEAFPDETIQVKNIYNNADKTFFPLSEYGTIPPTLFYAFGKAASDYDFAVTENDMIKLISRWMSNDKPTELIRFIAGKKVLAIGCKFDDWYFRFFWFCLRQNIDNLGGEVAISLSDSDSDKKLAKYLRSIHVKNKGNAHEFLQTISIQLSNPDDNVYKSYLPHLQPGGIFISYASEDFPIVCQIYRTIREKGYRVWFDNKALKGGDNYDKRIGDAIQQCRIFIPILSQQTKEDIDNRQITQRYYHREWEAVKDNKDCSIIPVTLSGFDISLYLDALPTNFQRTIVNWGTEGKEALLHAIEERIQTTRYNNQR